MVAARVHEGVADRRVDGGGPGTFSRAGRLDGGSKSHNESITTLRERISTWVVVDIL
jgi:hypothetical protein